MDIRPVVMERFAEPQKCHGHCDQPARMRVLKEDGEVLVATACPKGYVSRVAAYGRGDAANAVRSAVQRALGPGGDLRDEDIRTATRYAWDLGMEGSASGAVFKAAYWTQNYRRTKSEATNREATFACERCGSLFMQRLSSEGTLCASCSK